MRLPFVFCIGFGLLFSVATHAATVVLVAGGSGGDDSPATQAKVFRPFAVDFDKAGNMYIAEMQGGERVLKVGAKGILTTLAGTGIKGGGGDGGLALKAQFNGMHSLAVGPDGMIYIADTWNNRVRKIDPATGVISAFAGTGKKGFSGDGGPATQAEFSGVFCIAFDAKGERLYIDDLENRRIRAVDMKTQIVSTVAGNGLKGVPANGVDAKTSPLFDPRAITVDAKGNLYILERSGHALRVVDSAGRIRTVVGTGKPGADGDGGDALKAQLRGPKHLCVDHDGNVLIADTDNHCIRKYIVAEGKIARVAGVGTVGSAGVGGPPEQVQFSQPHGVCVHASGELYISDSYNNRVLKIQAGK